MPFIFKEVDTLDRDPPLPKVGSGGCVDLLKHYRQQLNPDGSFRNPSDNALAFFVIER